AITEQCQGGELNSRPRAYESPALPLSYPGAKKISSQFARRLNSRPTPNAFGAALPPSHPGAKFFWYAKALFLTPLSVSRHGCLYTIWANRVQTQLMLR